MPATTCFTMSGCNDKLFFLKIHIAPFQPTHFRRSHPCPEHDGNRRPAIAKFATLSCFYESLYLAHLKWYDFFFNHFWNNMINKGIKMRLVSEKSC